MDIEQAKIIPIQEVLYKHGDEICPKCGHKLDIGNTNRCRCHKCNTIYSTVDFIKALYGVSIPRAIEILTGGIDNISPVENEKIEITDIKERNLLMHLLDIDPLTRYDIEQIKNHPWFKKEGSKIKKE